jgi:hypothetical protein
MDQRKKTFSNRFYAERAHVSLHLDRSPVVMRGDFAAKYSIFDDAAVVDDAISGLPAAFLREAAAASVDERADAEEDVNEAEER